MIMNWKECGRWFVAKFKALSAICREGLRKNTANVTIAVI